jgi:hypothetical protein
MAVSEFKWHNKNFGQYMQQNGNSESFRRGENVSAGVHSSARSLSKLAAIMANQGQLGNIKLLSRDSFEQLHANPTVSFDTYFQQNTNFTQGGIA